MHQKQLLIAFPNQSCFFEKEGVVRSNSANSFSTLISVQNGMYMIVTTYIFPLTQVLQFGTFKLSLPTD